MKKPEIKAEFTHILSETMAGRAADLVREAEGKRWVRRFTPEERLIVLGGGHVAMPLCKMAAMLDFAVTVVDDRPSFANHQRFPEAKQVICDGFENALRSLELRATDYVCIITRGHRWDGVCLRTVLRGTEPSYLGMIGSRRRTTAMLEMLKEEGFDPAALKRVHTPIGLEIGALTTAEIAVSICAELVQHRRSLPEREGEPCLEQTNTDYALLRFMAESDEPAALMTVVDTRGSTPVDSGAIMAIDSLGRIYGTIGGGCGEAEAMAEGRRLIGTGRSKIIEVDMSNDVAEDEGMVCGGHMYVLLEDVTG